MQLSLKILQKFGNFAEYTPLQSKTSSNRKWKSYKRTSCFYGKKTFKLKKEIKPLDITDAIAIALTHAQRL